jgi:NAD(P)-dependent dehydrogenase (short-subunit alcohol dehydrogenase family)
VTAAVSTDAEATPASPGALAGRVVLVVGAHGGLGHAVSLACAEAGATVVLLGRKVPKLNRVYDAIVRQGGEALLYPLDLEGATPDDYAEMAERIESGLGRLDGVVHAAALFPGLTPLENTDPLAFARAIHVNLTARAWLTQACLPLLRRAPDSAVVFAIDPPSRSTNAYWGGYGLAQASNASLVRMLHSELAASSVRVAGLIPGPMRTALRGRVFVEEDDGQALEASAYAPACVRLLSPAGVEHRGEIWVPTP